MSDLPWISVEDRLPIDDSDYVLISKLQPYDEIPIEMGWFDQELSIWRDAVFGGECEVSHWLPITPPD